MEKLFIVVIAVLLCVSAAYKWVKYVESCSGAMYATLKGAKLRKAINCRQLTSE